MTETQRDFLEAIAGVVTGKSDTFHLSEEVKKEAIAQAVLPLISKESDTLAAVSRNVRLIYEQSELGKIFKDIPYVILKGTAASVYYPEPLRRVLGDIDVIVNPMDYDRACAILLDNNYIIPPNSGDDRHGHFLKNGITLELHRRFAILQTKEQEELLDGVIYEGIKTPVIEHLQRFSFPRLDDTKNGLVLLAHLNQHLEEGLGFRQILDWVMFVDKCLPDKVWPEFKKISDDMGLTTLAKVTTKLGQKYLGLKSDEYTWCQDADDGTVKELLEYAFYCGNFGHKDLRNNTVVMVMSHWRNLREFLQSLQKQGKTNWKILKKCRWLIPLAWIYQLGRYIRLGFRNSSLKDLTANYRKSKRRNQMIDKLEVTRNTLKRK